MGEPANYCTNFCLGTTEPSQYCLFMSLNVLLGDLGVVQYRSKISQCTCTIKPTPWPQIGRIWVNQQVVAQNTVCKQQSHPFEAFWFPKVMYLRIWGLSCVGSKSHIMIKAEHHLVGSEWTSNFLHKILLKNYQDIFLKLPSACKCFTWGLGGYAVWV